MSHYVLKHNETGRFVARPGLAHSYTAVLELALTFPTKEAAEADKCGNEHAVEVEQLLGWR